MIINDNEACLRIEDPDDSYFQSLNLCWLTEKEINKLIEYLQEAKKKIVERRQKINRIVESTDFNKMYTEFDEKYNPYPVQMSRASAFRMALCDQLINQDTYDAAFKYYGNLWNYVGD